MDIRRKHGDLFRAALPAETTVVGSSGVGCFKVGSNPADVFATLDKVAAETPPIQTSLGAVIRFPNTDIFVFTFTDESGLRALHQRIVGSGLQFEDNPWPFGPHVTLRSRSPVSDDDAASLLDERIAEPFVLDQLSVFQLSDDPEGQAPVVCNLLHRTHLAGTSGRS